MKQQQASKHHAHDYFPISYLVSHPIAYQSRYDLQITLSKAFPHLLKILSQK